MRREPWPWNCWTCVGHGTPPEPFPQATSSHLPVPGRRGGTRGAPPLRWPVVERIEHVAVAFIVESALRRAAPPPPGRPPGTRTPQSVQLHARQVQLARSGLARRLGAL